MGMATSKAEAGVVACSRGGLSGGGQRSSGSGGGGGGSSSGGSGGSCQGGGNGASIRFLLRSSSIGLLGLCLALLRSFLAGLPMGFLLRTHALNSLERSLKRTHVHRSHPFLMEVVLILPLVRTHLENMTCQISLGERNICRCHTRIVARAVVPAGQLRNIGVELLYMLYKLTYDNPLELFELLER
jgi:hypothetical protein